ncbi:MAG: sigma-70 family RNA polymerase sigma factor [Rariglobus sp.]
MQSVAPSPALAFSAFVNTHTNDSDNRLAQRYQQGDSNAFLSLIRRHHRSIFHLAHALLRDEVAAEKITQEVFARARRHFDRGLCPSSVTAWLYYASLRFARQFHWKSNRNLARRRLTACSADCQLGLDLKEFVQVIVRCHDKIEPRDCELLSLRHVLGMPLANIAQLLRMHPYEISNRLVWARERVLKLSRQLEPDNDSTMLFPMSA